MGIIGLPVGLIIVQPDFGTAATFVPLVAVAMFFGGIRMRVWVIMILIGLIAMPAGWLFFLKPYQKERIMIFMNPERDPLGTGYQVTQAKIAIGSGGIHGKGFKQGTQAPSDSSPPGTPISSSPSSAKNGDSSASSSCSASISI
ncbi:MAG: hypothetical protein NVSMB68_14260 [Thermoanaerobaculia bacterium]